MKRFKFVSLALVTLAIVAVIAPQPARATLINVVFDIHLNATVTEGLTGEHTLTISGAKVFDAHVLPGFVVPADTPVTFKKISWTGGVDTPTVLQGAPVMSFWQLVAQGGKVISFDLSELTVRTLDSERISLDGAGTLSFEGRSPLHAGFDLASERLGEDFTYVDAVSHTEAVANTPDGGSALSLVTVALTALESLRRKIGTRQNSYT